MNSWPRNKFGFQAPGLLRFEWLFHAFGTIDSEVPPGPLASVRQVHSASVIRAASAGVQGEGDALITAAPDLFLGIRTADCFPVLIADRRTHAVAAVHAGWRGVAGGIVPATVRALQAGFGSAVEDLQIAIGPGIGACCFEVGPEVAAQFQRQGRIHLDLAAEIAAQCKTLGVSAAKIETSHLCTFCHAPEFFSYRRQGAAAGRMVSVIGAARHK